MPTIATGLKISVSNTPQAKDDVYGMAEDMAQLLNVLANDLGGNAKTLYSLSSELTIEDGGSATAASMISAVPVQTITTDLGATATIVNGMISYSTCNLDFLAQDEERVDVFSYVIRLSSGAFSIATVSVTVKGSNDVPVVTGAVAGAATEDGATSTLDALANASDIDNGAVLNVVGIPAELPAGVTYDAAAKTFTLDPSAAAYQSLAAGVTTTVIVNYSVSDGIALPVAASVSWIVTGTNDVPVANAAVAAVDEDASITGSVSATDADASETETLTYVLVDPLDAPVGLIFNTDGSYSFDASSYDYLPQGEELVLIVPFVAKDATSTSASANLTITITGTNDGPVAAADTGSAGENQTISIDVLANDTDADTGHILTVLSASAPAGKGSASVVANQVKFNPGTDFDHLAKDATEEVVVSYTISDEHGAESSSTVAITVTGTNDGPVAVADAAAGTENQTLTINVLANDTDVDDGAILSLVSASAPSGKGSASVVGNAVQFNPGADFDRLKAGATETVVLNYTIKDEHGALSSSTVTILITGTNDGPVLSDTVNPGPVVEAAVAAAQNLDAIVGSFAVSDLDVGDTLTASVVGDPVVKLGDALFTLPEGASALTAAGALVLTGATSNGGAASIGYSWDPGAANLDFLRAGQSLTVTYTVKVNDGTADSGTQDVTFTILGTNDIPVVTGAVLGSATEDAASATLSALANASDVDSGTVLLVVGVPAPADLPAGVSYDATAKTFTLDPSVAAYQSLAAGATTTVTVNYAVSDSIAAPVPASVSWIVTGTNDVPVASAAVAAVDEDAGITGSVTATDADAGQTATLTYALVDPLTKPVGLTLNANGSYNFDASSYDSLPQGEQLVFNVAFVAKDAVSTSAPANLKITVTGTNDVPVVTGAVAGSATEDGLSSTLNALANASDADAGTVLDVVTVPLSLPAGVTYDAVAKSFTLDPTGDAYQSLASGATTTVTVHYAVSDGVAPPVAASVSWLVTGTNDVPVVNGITAATNEDTIYNGTVTGSDIDGNPLTYALAPGQLLPAGVAFNSNGAFSVTPLASDQGLDSGESRVVSFQIVANDGTVNSAPQTLQVTINGVNDAPVVAPLADQTVAEDNLVNFTLPAGAFTDVDGESLTLSARLADGSALPSWLNFNAGSRTFSGWPPVNFNGELEIQVTASDEALSGNDVFKLTITPVNDAPVSMEPFEALPNETEDQAFVLTQAQLIQGFEDPEGDAILANQFWSDDAVIVINGDGSITVTPDADFNGELTLSYVVEDVHGLWTPTSRTIVIDPVNDAPVATNLNAPETYTEDTLLNLTDIVASDIDSPSLTVTLTLSSAAAGALNTATSGAVTSTYNAGTGVWMASGATANVNALLAGLTFNPAANFNGSFTIGTSVSDGIAPAVTGTKVVTGIPVNDAPAANPDTGSAGENEIKSFDVLANDTDVDIGDTKALVSVGTIIVNGVAATASQAAAFSIVGGQIQFNPGTAFDSLNTGQSANVVVNYTMKDSSNSTSSSVLNLTVTGRNEVATFNADNLRFLLNTTTENEGGTQGQTIVAGADLGMFQAIGLPGAWTFTLASPSPSFTISGNHLIASTSLAAETISLSIRASDGTSIIDIPVTVQVGNNGSNTISFGSGTDLGFGIGNKDTISGAEGNDSLSGGSDNDSLAGGAGSDVLWGASGADNLNGGAGADLLTGGVDADKFIYSATSDSGPTASDTITDFQEAVANEQIDLFAIDAILGGGNDAFGFVAAQNGSAVANSITWQQSGGNTIVRIDNTGDTTADMVITLLGLHTLTSNDFIL